MRPPAAHTFAFGLALLLAAPAVHADPPAAADTDLRITELLPAPDGPAGQREFVEVLNAGNATVDLMGWRLRDAPTASNLTNEYTFGPLLLGAGERIVVWSNGSADALGPAWSSSPSKTVWNDGGDAATLLDPDGAIEDWFGYGSTTQAAPPGSTGVRPSAPARGKSLQVDGGVWGPADPTPGLAPGQAGGAVSARVANVPPTVTVTAAQAVRSGEALAVHVVVQDDNGGADIVAWTLLSQGQAIRQGNGTFNGTVIATAPAQGGAWTLSASVRDAAGANATATATVLVRQPHLSVALPPGGALRFPDLRPGDRDVTSVDALTLRNDGEVAATPLVDVSEFRAGVAHIAVEGNLWVGVTVAGATTWVRYDAPLQPLPTLQPGASATLALRIGAVPVPAPAGLYGTTFTVVAA